jgi:hypothetical protein
LEGVRAGGDCGVGGGEGGNSSSVAGNTLAATSGCVGRAWAWDGDRVAARGWRGWKRRAGEVGSAGGMLAGDGDGLVVRSLLACAWWARGGMRAGVPEEEEDGMDVGKV